MFLELTTSDKAQKELLQIRGAGITPRCAEAESQEVDASGLVKRRGTEQ